MKIKKLGENEMASASKLLWESFYETEKNNFSMRGLEKFRDLTSEISLKMNTFDDYIALFGAFEGDELLGVGAVREKKHIFLLYVKKGYYRKGIGSFLLSYLESECVTDEITVNASDCGVAFYEKHGFKKVKNRTIEDDFIFTPMKKNR